jgi:hypothetical protein
MKVKFYKIEKRRIGDDDVIVIYRKGNFSGTMEVKNGELFYHGKRDVELLDILFRPYHILVPSKSGLRQEMLQPGTPQHLEAIRRTCWNHGYIAELEEG